MATKKEVRLEGAPDWYGTPLDELDFEWSVEEELEIERYCEKILKNVAEEEMTPLERFKAHMAGKPKDRKLMVLSTSTIYTPRTLDSYADALKPVDLMRNPKLLVKGLLASVARFKMDYPFWHIFSYTEELWGGRAKMIDYGNPCAIGDPAVKSMADLEGIEVPDPYSDGLYPGWLWANREMRRIFDKYHIPMPIWTSIGPDPTSVVMMGIMGIAPFMIALRKDPELARRCCDLAFQWNIKICQALIDVCSPEGIYVCQMTGGFPLKGSEWVGDQLAELAKAIRAYSPRPLHLSHGYSFLSGVFQWYEILHERGSLTPNAFDGGVGMAVEDIDMKKVLDWHREHNLYLCICMRDEIIGNGPVSAIEENMKTFSEYGKSHPKFTLGMAPVWHVPQPHVDTAVAAFKKYNKC